MWSAARSKRSPRDRRSPTRSTYADAVGILKSYRIWETAPAGIRAHLEKGLAGEAAETLKPGDPLLERSRSILVGSNQVAAHAALAQASREGFNSLLLTTYLQGEASQAGNFLAAVARQVDATGAPVPRPACILAGGETTVTLRGDGLGGRNQEVALGAVEGLAGIPGALLVTLATDGEDATTGAAGAARHRGDPAAGAPGRPGPGRFPAPEQLVSLF